MVDTLVGTFGLLVGCAVLTFRKPLVREILRQQSLLFRIDFAERQKKISGYVAILVGLSFITLGLSALVGIVEVKPS